MLYNLYDISTRRLGPTEAYITSNITFCVSQNLLYYPNSLYNLIYGKQPVPYVAYYITKKRCVTCYVTYVIMD